MTSPGRFSLAVVRWLIRLYPREFRDRYGREMEQLVRDAAADGAPLRWRRILPDLLVGAIRERAAASRHRRDADVPHPHLTPPGDRMGTPPRPHDWRPFGT